MERRGVNSHPAQLSEAIARVRAHTEQKKDESGRLRSRMAYARLMHSIDAIAMQKRAIDSLLPTIEGDEKAEELKDELIKEMIKSKCHRIGDEAATFKRFKGIEAVLQHRIRQRGSLPQPTKTKILRRNVQTDRVWRSAGAGAANEIPGTMQDIIESIKPPAPSSEAAKAAAAAEAATAMAELRAASRSRNTLPHMRFSSIAPRPSVAIENKDVDAKSNDLPNVSKSFPSVPSTKRDDLAKRHVRFDNDNTTNRATPGIGGAGGIARYLNTNHLQRSRDEDERGPTLLPSQDGGRQQSHWKSVSNLNRNQSVDVPKDSFKTASTAMGGALSGSRHTTQRAHEGEAARKIVVAKRSTLNDERLTKPFKTPVPNSLSRRHSLGRDATGKIAANGNNEETGLSDHSRTILRLDPDDPLPESLANISIDLIEKICNEVPNRNEKTEFKDIAGCVETKRVIREAVLYPLLNPEIFKGPLMSPPRGILLFGPPGTGKTMLGKAIADNMTATFFSISSTSLTSKWVGEGEKMVRTLFAVAKHAEPSVIFIDEIDSLLSARKSEGENEASRRMKTQFLVEMEGCHDDKSARILTVGATNRPEEIDSAARRRFPKQIYVPLPDSEARREFLVTQLGKADQGHQLTEDELDAVVKETDGYSGSDLRHVLQEAAMEVFRSLLEANQMSDNDVKGMNPDDMRPIALSDVKHGVATHAKSVSEDEIIRFEEYNNLYGTKVSFKKKGDGV